MQTPATTPRPICCLPNAKTTSCPRPAAPIKPAMMTTDRTIMIVWFTPSRIDGSGQRELHLAQQLPRRRSERSPRFHDLVRDLPDAQVREPDPTGKA